MIGLTIDTVKKGFFDREAVLKKLDAQQLRMLSRLGAFVTRRDKTSQRRRKGVSEQGKPPSAHLGLIRDNTFFSLDDSGGRKGVVIGPIALNRGHLGLLRALEEGGESTTMDHGKVVKTQVAARPHTQPAFAKELTKLPSLLGG